MRCCRYLPPSPAGSGDTEVLTATKTSVNLDIEKRFPDARCMSKYTNAGAVALSEWLKTTGKTVAAFSREHSFVDRTVASWAQGRALPRVDRAILLEEATEGAVQVHLWGAKVPRRR